MDATRICRAQRPARKAMPARAVPAPATPSTPLPLERLALVALVLGRERAAELLKGLGTRDVERGRQHLSRFAALPSAQRQARVAVSFGVVEDAAERLREVMEDASEPLRREIFRRLPPYHRSLFPWRRVEPPDAKATPSLCALAERLIREATR